MYKFTGEPFNLTATVLSESNLTSLYWSRPNYYDPAPDTIITVHHVNITTTTFMLLTDGGIYTLTAVNKCGQSSSQVDVVRKTTN